MATTAMKHMASSFAKLEKFEGVDFRRWQKKMHFMISSMSVVYVLTTPMPDNGGENPTVEQVRKRAKWDNDDYVYREAKYMAEDASSKKFLVSNFTNYKMTDSRPVLEQYNELLGILGRFTQHKMNMDKSIMVSRIIDKLPPSWKDFKHTLKHLKEELTLIELGSHLRIEESLRVQDNDKPKGKIANTNKKPKVTCWKCGKPGHLKKDCKGGNVGNRANRSSTKGSEDGLSNPLKGQSMFNKSHQIYCVTYVSEAFFVQDDDVAWWVDSGAIVHVCKDRCWFKTYESLNDGSILHMGNESTALVHGRSCVDLRFNSGKVVSLLNVLHVPNIRKNLVSSSVLNNCGYKQVIESNKFVLSKHGVLIGFGYLSNHMFRLNIVSDNIGLTFMSTSKLNDSILWHARLGHVHFKRMQDMSKDGLIPAFDMDTEKCQTCMLSKITKKPFQNVKRKSKVLELIQSDLCDLHATPSLGNNYIPRLSGSILLNLMIQLLLTLSFNQGMLSLMSIGTRDEVSDQHSYCFNVEDEPKTFDDAMKSQDVSFWKEAINDEIDSIMGNNTWVLTDLPLGCKPLGCKWIFKRKMKVDGTVEKFKARLVIQGFKQSLIIHQMDVKTAFLNGELEEEAPKQWHQKFDEVVLSNVYLLNQVDKCVYSKFDASGKGVIICLYVDDMLIFGTDQAQVYLTKEFLSSRFSMKDIGEADVILGIRIKHESNGIEISQSHYIEKVLKKFNYSDCTPVSTPLDTCEKLMPNKGLAVSQLEYSRVIGFLMYAMTCTRPDIAFVVGKLSRYTSNPVLEGYTDASWISNTKDNSSTSGWVFLLSGGAISWASKKQTCIIGSTMEYEFMALEAAGKEAEWLKNLLLEIPLWVKPMAPISIRYDSAATLAKAYSQMYNGKSRHLGVRHSMICELITNGVISIEFVRSQQNLADHLTKGLTRDLVIKSAKWMGLKSNQVAEC
ncbi:zinc finger, CCHC-type containing protein [Tanacetum coccineum]